MFGFFDVVARDGIEPPTPAFSGPRSTTELPGLRSQQFRGSGVAAGLLVLTSPACVGRELAARNCAQPQIRASVYQWPPNAPNHLVGEA